MATVFKKPGSPFWYARFQIDGKDYALSTEKTNRHEAVSVMRLMVQERKGTVSVDEVFEIVLRQLKKMEDEAETPRRKIEVNALRQNMAQRIVGGQNDKVTLKDAWLAWMANPLKRNPGPVTIGGYERQWVRFKMWVEDKRIEYLHEITPIMTQDYAAHLWESKVSPGTYNAHIKFLKSMFKVLKLKAGLSSNPWEQIPMKELERESRRNFTPEELKEVCSKAQGNLRYMIGLGLYTGMRLGDVVNLRWDEVRRKEGIIEHIPMKTARKKKKIRLPIHPVLEALLKELHATSKGEYLFPVEREQYHADHAAVTKVIQQFFGKCGIKTTEQATNGHRRRAIVRVGFHSLRHSFVSLCAANHVPQVAIMELVGHGSPAMTALYSHAGDEQKAAAIAALPAMKFLPGKTRKGRK